ncbi:MAG TPA: N-formylglutamate amidohydrolase [Stellaceae bacterium]|nr:N-formylglutamate amidohydrolase [Stellaceae bacterium]
MELGASVDPPFEVAEPGQQQVALVCASPHSGSDYPAAFLAASRLDALTLRRSEDSFVDEIFGSAIALGAPLLKARFPRAYLDPNREPYELDPTMFADPLPAYVNSRSPRVQVGLGTIARVVATGEEIYAHKLRFADALSRVDRLYRPYHQELRRLLAATRESFAGYLLIDCHSMPSTAGPGEREFKRSGVDIVLGDCHGTSCHPVIMETAQRILTAKGYRVVRNAPYAGGFTTSHYGAPQGGRHAIQIEINRALYMDERSIERKPFLGRMTEDMSDLMSALAALQPRQLKAA